MRKCQCLNCGANLTIDDQNRDFAFCQYCGAKIMLDDFRSTQRIVDEAKIKQAETERMIRLKELEIELEQQKKNSGIRKVLFIIWIICFIIITGLCLYIGFTQELGGMWAFNLLLYVGGPIVGGGAYLLFKTMPEKENEKKIIRQGGIRFPKNFEPFSSNNFEALEIALKEAGFQNITCANKHDITWGLLQRPGRIDSVSVNGKEITSGGKVYMPDASIVISYHGK